jgi:hypothetical protein
MENTDIDLSTDSEHTTGITYLSDGRLTHASIDCGWGLCYNPVEDSLTPESVFSPAPPTYKIFGAGSGE